MLKRILINLLLIIIAICTVEFASFQEIKSKNEAFKQQADRAQFNNTQNFQTKYRVLEDFNPTVFRNSSLKKTNKTPILWLGCSFAEGAGLEDKNTPCFKISDLTGRSCINKSKGATGAQYMYYQLTDKNLKNDYPNVDFVIYTFIWNHLHRLYNYQVNPLIDMVNLRYKVDSKGNLVQYKPLFKPIYSSFFIKRILNRQVSKNIKKEEQDFKLFNAVMKQSANTVHQLYPNAKFIMIEFPELSKKELPQSEIDTLKSYGIEVIKAADYMKNIDIYDKKYWQSDEIHPREELWDMVLLQIVKKYKM